MKLKITFFFLTLLASLFVTVNAQTIKKSTSTINSTEQENRIIIHKGVEYYINNGIWFAKINNRLIFKKAPLGAKIPFIPGEGKTVILGGEEYFRCNDIFYKKLKTNLYEVSRP